MPRAEDLWTRFQRYVAVCKHGPRCKKCCHEWIGSRDRYGYGRIKMTPAIRAQYHIYTQVAPRVLWQLLCFPLASWQHVCHRCDNPPCVNLAHLWLGDARANHLDSQRKGRKPVKDSRNA